MSSKSTRRSRSRIKFNVLGPQLESFKKIAKKAFPIEDFGILLGYQDSRGEYILKGILLPGDRYDRATNEMVDTQVSWYEAAKKVAKKHGYEILGDIHTHCYDVDKGEEVAGLGPSAQDWHHVHCVADDFPSAKLFGVMRIVKKNEKMRADWSFWAIPDSVIIKEHDGKAR